MMTPNYSKIRKSEIIENSNTQNKLECANIGEKFECSTLPEIKSRLKPKFSKLCNYTA